MVVAPSTKTFDCRRRAVELVQQLVDGGAHRVVRQLRAAAAQGVQLVEENTVGALRRAMTKSRAGCVRCCRCTCRGRR